jgi:arabinogalactan endo-1,4-beta-galactosidase
VNPGFEDATTSPWTFSPGGAATSIVDTGDPRFGSRTVKISRSGSSTTYVRQILTLPAGSYVFSFDIKIEGTPSMCEPTLAVTGTSNQGFGNVVSEDWITYTKSMVMTSQTSVGVRVIVGCTNNNNDRFIYFDNVLITRTA